MYKRTLVKKSMKKGLLMVIIALILLATAMLCFNDTSAKKSGDEKIIHYELAERSDIQEGTAPRTMTITPPASPPASSTEEAQAQTLSIVIASSVMIGGILGAISYIYLRRRKRDLSDEHDGMSIFTGKLVLGVLICLMGVVLLAIISSETQATIITVDDDGPADFTKIQDAVDAASDGDTIIVYEGNYYENVNIGKSLTLTGKNRDTTIIDGGGSGNVMYITTDWVNVSGFTVTNSGSPSNVGIKLNNAQNCHIAHNTVSNNRHGISLYRSSNCTLTNNTCNSNNWDGIGLNYYSNSN
ncbi:MAG: right-handed parallel beta-helix repeat-containing protein [Thermoplasmata archaeon]|nr:right-handed parallel beta-helix repeat-containing protein [Thermoplasmata archaeon]